MERMEGVRLMKRADALRVEGRRGGRPKFKGEDCMKRYLAGMENEGEGWGGVEMSGGDGSEMGLAMKGKQKSTTGISASLNPDYRDKEESNNKYEIWKELVITEDNKLIDTIINYLCKC